MDVSLLISVHNRVELTRACIDSIFATMPSGVKWEVLVYDDLSTDGTAEYLNDLAETSARVQVVRQGARGNFAINNNKLARLASGRWLLFLNNDTVCLANWFEPMYALAVEADAGGSKAGVIGSLQVFAEDGLINHAGVVIDERGLPCHLYEGLAPDLSAAGVTREMQAVTAACWLTSAEIFESLGGFYEEFRNGYEDVDYCLRLREAGSAVWYCGASKIVHYGGCTSNRFDYESENQVLFLARSQGLAVPDLVNVTKGDDVHWPVHTMWYRTVRGIWTGRLVQPVARRLLRFGLVVKLRNQVIRLLTPAPPHIER